MKEGEIVKIGTPGEIITPAVLEEVFRINARVMIDPATGAPVCFGYDNLSQQEVYKEVRFIHLKVVTLKVGIFHQMIFPNQLTQTNTSNFSGMVSI